MTNKRWRDMSPGAKTALLVAGSVDLGLRAWALIDLKNRPQEQVRGSKRGWAIALATVNSTGILPTVYLSWARKR